ncbi:MAG TPA: CoA pyrophosphatase [Acidimicrobiales bacterium]|nr:CoA pyrophosphatase [Acidimicrobiales bacterium]
MSSSDPAVPPQIVPRPPTARPGGPPPWSGLPPGRRRHLTLEVVLDALDRAGHGGDAPPPGEAPAEVLDSFVSVERAALAAVLVALFEERGEARVVLTRRSTRLRSHRGEVSFPGGRAEPGEDPWAAAVREAAEEVGLDPATVTRHGWLQPVVTFQSGSFIMPVVGGLPGRPVLVANPAEVDRVFDVALTDLLADDVFHEELWMLPESADSDGRERPIWFFEAAGELVWGATARVLTELLAVVVGVKPPPR